MSPTEIAQSGPLLLAVAVALLAGAVSFASPCCIPLVPGYLAYLAGLTGAEAPPVTADEAERRAANRAGRWRVVLAALLFVGGFTVVFGLATIAVLGLSDAMYGSADVLQRVGGVITIAMGLVFLGFIPALQRDVRIHRQPAKRGLWGAPLLGAVFGLGWAPCLSPTLIGVMAVATGTSVGPTTLRGVVLVLAYCLGLGLPFVLLALGARWALRSAGWLRRHTRGVQLTGGVLLVVVGLMLVTGTWAYLVQWLQITLISTTELPI
ncbi:cytochrome c biogenesis CcdA family protein [Allokutzneria oryzae]|uniref:Cytochrome c biogenesis CcdA family protein n=1 Tax=Allokutzneria oryzae TaxID=1378989 RepID=A0ABV5ZWD4_9PSEU